MLWTLPVTPWWCSPKTSSFASLLQQNMVPFRNPVANSFLPEAPRFQWPGKRFCIGFSGNSQILNGLQWTLEGHNSKYCTHHLLQIQNAAYLCSDHQVQGVSFSETWHFNFTVYWLWPMSDQARVTVVNIFTLALTPLLWSRKSNCGQYLHSISNITALITQEQLWSMSSL